MKNRRIVIRISEENMEQLSKVDLALFPEEVQIFVSEFLARFAIKLPRHKLDRAKSVETWGVAPYTTKDPVAVRMSVSPEVLEYCHREDNIFRQVPGDIDGQIIYILEEKPKGAAY